MEHDQTFRAALLAVTLVVLPIALFYRLKAHVPRERLDRRKEGWFILLTLRPVGLALWVGSIAYMIDPSSMRWSAMPLPPTLRWAGVGVGFVSAGLLFWTLHSLGRNLTDTVVTRERAALVTDGPYRWVRHPFYGCVALFLLSIALMTANWFLLIGGCAVIALAVLRTTREEAELVRRFGDAYRDYMGRTGRFLPGIR